MTSLKSIRIALEESINATNTVNDAYNKLILLRSGVKAIIALLKEEEKYECILKGEIDEITKVDKETKVPNIEEWYKNDFGCGTNFKEG